MSSVATEELSVVLVSIAAEMKQMRRAESLLFLG